MLFAHQRSKNCRMSEPKSVAQFMGNQEPQIVNAAESVDLDSTLDRNNAPILPLHRLPVEPSFNASRRKQPLQLHTPASVLVDLPPKTLIPIQERSAQAFQLLFLHVQFQVLRLELFLCLPQALSDVLRSATSLIPVPHDGVVVGGPSVEFFHAFPVRSLTVQITSPTVAHSRTL